MQPKNPILQKCINHLNALPSIETEVHGEPYFSENVLADGKLTVSTPNKSVDYICEVKVGLTQNLVGNVVQYLSFMSRKIRSNERPLLITHGLSNIVIDQLIENDIEFVDADDNLYLNCEEVYVLVRRHYPNINKKKAVEITAAALQVMYVLLQEPDIALGDSRAWVISQRAGVSPKTVKNTLEKLIELGYIAKSNQDGYEVVDYLKLLERWELGYSERLRAKLFLGSFKPIGLSSFRGVGYKIINNQETLGYLIGGELAAALVTDYLQPTSATLHVADEAHTRKVAVALKLKPDPDGEIVFLKSFGDYNLSDKDLTSELIHPLLVHAELVYSGNSRLQEVANRVYDRYIEASVQHCYV